MRAWRFYTIQRWRYNTANIAAQNALLILIYTRIDNIPRSCAPNKYGFAIT